MRQITCLFLLIILMVPLAGCADENKNVSTDEIGIKYSGGSIEGKKFTEIREPGSTDYWNSNDPIYRLPLTQRSYVIRVDRDRDEGNNPDVNGVLSLPVYDPETGSSLELSYELALTFKINTRADDIEGFEGGTLRRFFEQICRSYQCWINDDDDLPDGWRKMLREKLFTSLETALKDSARKFKPEDQVNNALVEDPDEAGRRVPARELLQRETAQAFREHLKRLVGGDYFCGPSFDRNIDNGCPPVELLITSVDYTNPEIRRSREAKQIASNLAEAQETLREPIRNPNYLRYLEIQAMEQCVRSARAVCVFGGSSSDAALARRR